MLKVASRPIRALSLEFAPEFLDRMLACVSRLQSLADYEFNLALDEPDALESDSWLTAAQIEQHLRKYEADFDIFGDVYARLCGDGT